MKLFGQHYAYKHLNFKVPTLHIMVIWLMTHYAMLPQNRSNNLKAYHYLAQTSKLANSFRYSLSIRIITIYQSRIFPNLYLKKIDPPHSVNSSLIINVSVCWYISVCVNLGAGWQQHQQQEQTTIQQQKKTIKKIHQKPKRYDSSSVQWSWVELNNYGWSTGLGHREYRVQ